MIRCCLTKPEMQPHLDLLHTFMSLTSPHVGFLFARGIVNTAVWIFRRLQKSVALEQLSLSDHADLTQTFFYKLSQQSAPMARFAHVILVGSHQDNYAPFHSARIEMTEAAIEQSKNNADSKSAANVLKSMINGIMKHVDPSKLVRIDVNYFIGTTNLDSTIGRTAHIRCLDSCRLTAALLLHLRDWFE